MQICNVTYNVKIKFLGTGGVLGSPVWNCDCATCTSTDPRDKRYRSSILICTHGKNIIVDFGTDFSHQLIKYGIKKIDYAFLTHAHGDHSGGIAQLSVAENCVLMSPADVWAEVFAGGVSSRKWLVTRNKTLTLGDFVPQKIGGFIVDTIKLEHQKDYAATPDPCYGYLFRSKKFSFAYCSDFSRVLEPEKLENLDLIISDGNGMENKGHGHVGVAGSIEIFNRFHPKQMLLTHIPHSIKHADLVAFLAPHPNIGAAFDGLELDCGGE
jgi:phosphoribosyl 1,2-cyclic phosphate phosphodiesterase